MSDEMKNITEQTAQQDLEQMAAQSEQDALSEEIRRRLAEPGSGKPTLEEFKLMVYKDRERRRKKRNTMVACIVAAFIVGFFSFEYLVPEVGADKNPKETIQTEDGVIIEDGGYGSSEEEDNVWVTEDWEHVKDAKAIAPKILIPQYIPENYVFEHLKVEIVETGDIICEYIFSGPNNLEIEIEEYIMCSGELSLDVNDVSQTFTSEKGLVHIEEYEETIAIIQIDDGITVNMWSSLGSDEIKKIINGLD